MPPSSPPDPLRAPDALGPAPHDLLEIASARSLAGDGPLPAWAGESLARAPVVVVRRSVRRGALLPVGVRGPERGQRHAAWLPARAVVRCLRPEELAGRRAAGLGPQLAALDAAREILGALGLRFGPVGSVAFQLATGVVCVTARSDLDLLVRAPAPLPREEARRLLAALSSLPVRVDVQLETPGGGVALAEWAEGRPRLALRTAEGPRLVGCPWPSPGEPGRAT